MCDQDATDVETTTTKSLAPFVRSRKMQWPFTTGASASVLFPWLPARTQGDLPAHVERSRTRWRKCVGSVSLASHMSFAFPFPWLPAERKETSLHMSSPRSEALVKCVGSVSLALFPWLPARTQGGLPAHVKESRNAVADRHRVGFVSLAPRSNTRRPPCTCRAVENRGGGGTGESVWVLFPWLPARTQGDLPAQKNVMTPEPDAKTQKNRKSDAQSLAVQTRNVRTSRMPHQKRQILAFQ